MQPVCFLFYLHCFVFNENFLLFFDSPGPNIDAADCRGSFKVPTDLAPGIYTFMWWWEFNPGQFYNSCADINVVADPVNGGDDGNEDDEDDGGQNNGDQDDGRSNDGRNNKGNSNGGVSGGLVAGLFFLGTLLGIAAALFLWKREEANSFNNMAGAGGPAAPQPSPAGTSRAQPPRLALPKGWEAVLDKETGDTYYYNESTGESTWTNPASKHISLA